MFEDLIGKSFSYDPAIGYSCWSLVVETCSRVGIRLPDYNIVEDASYIKDLVKIEKPKYLKIEQPEPYCLVLFRIPNPKKLISYHIGMVLLDTRFFIHAARGTGVCIARLNSPAYWLTREGFYKLCN